MFGYIPFSVCKILEKYVKIVYNTNGNKLNLVVYGKIVYVTKLKAKFPIQ